MTIQLTDEQREALHAKNGGPAEVVDPFTRQCYVLLALEEYERLRAASDNGPAPIVDSRSRISPTLLRSQEAFWRDLPGLLHLSSKKSRWVAYHGDERVGFANTQLEAYQQCLQRGLERGEFYVGKIEKDETPPWGTFEGDKSLYEYIEGGQGEDIGDAT